MAITTFSFPASGREPLTPEVLRTFPAFSHYTETQAAEIIDTIDALARFFLDAAMRHGTHYDKQRPPPIPLPLHKKALIKRAA